MTRRADADRHGFTLIELLVVVLILGLLTTLGMLRFADLRNTARTSQVAGDIRVLTVGAYNYFADHEEWPPEVGPGVVPPGLEPYIPGFSLEKPEYTLDWDNLGLGGANFMVGVTVTSSDATFMEKLERNLGSKYPYFKAGGSLTYIIVDLRGTS